MGLARHLLQTTVTDVAQGQVYPEVVGCGVGGWGFRNLVPHIPTAETSVQPARMHTHNRLALQSRNDLVSNARRSITGP